MRRERGFTRGGLRGVMGALLVLHIALHTTPAAAQAPPAATPKTSGSSPAPSATPGGAPSPGAPRAGHVRLEFLVAPGLGGCDSEAMFRKLVMLDAGGVDPFVLRGDATHVLQVRFTKGAPGVVGSVELFDAGGKSLDLADHTERNCSDASDWASIAAMAVVFPAGGWGPKVNVNELLDRLAGQDAKITALEATLRAQQAALTTTQDENRTQDRKIDALTARGLALEAALEKVKKKMELTFALATGALITANLTSNVGPGVWFGGEGRAGPLSLGLEVRGVLPSPVPVGPYDFDLSQFVGLLVPCGRYSYFFGCAVVGVGAQLIYDSNYAPPGDPRNPNDFIELLQVGGRIGAEIPIGDTMFAVRGWGEVLYATPSWDFTYKQTGDVWARPDVSAFFGLGIVLKLGE